VENLAGVKTLSEIVEKIKLVKSQIERESEEQLKGIWQAQAYQDNIETKSDILTGKLAYIGKIYAQFHRINIAINEAKIKQLLNSPLVKGLEKRMDNLQDGDEKSIQMAKNDIEKDLETIKKIVMKMDSNSPEIGSYLDEYKNRILAWPKDEGVGLKTIPLSTIKRAAMVPLVGGVLLGLLSIVAAGAEPATTGKVVTETISSSNLIAMSAVGLTAVAAKTGILDWIKGIFGKLFGGAEVSGKRGKDTVSGFTELVNLRNDAEQLVKDGKLGEAVVVYERILHYLEDGEAIGHMEKNRDFNIDEIKNRMQEIVWEGIKDKVAYLELIIDNNKPIVVVGEDYNSDPQEDRIESLIKLQNNSKLEKEFEGKKFTHLALGLTQEQIEGVLLLDENTISGLVKNGYTQDSVKGLQTLIRTARNSGVTVVPLLDNPARKFRDRDRIMYERVKEIYDTNKDSRILVYVENGHVVNAEGTMGNMLKMDKSLGEKVFLIGCLDFFGFNKSSLFLQRYLGVISYDSVSMGIKLGNSSFDELTYAGFNSPRKVNIPFKDAFDGILINGLDYISSSYEKALVCVIAIGLALVGTVTAALGLGNPADIGTTGADLVGSIYAPLK
jgi:hypothetical protein